jgi:tRNA(fMet)-specific endonuclease VapC
MPLPNALLDTDTVSFLIQRRPVVLAKAQAYVAEHGILAVSIVTRYEILRGLRVKNATRKMAVFTQFCQRNSIVPLTEATVSIAADIYANLYARGLLIGDADILIAATAMSHGLVVVTNNESHFRRIEGLTVENWAALS